MTVSTKKNTNKNTTKGKVGFSNYDDKKLCELDEIYGANHYGRLQTIVRKTEGAWLYTEDGRKILDCLAAYSAANPGHHHPKIVKALVDALESGFASVVSNVVYTDLLSLMLCQLLPI